MAVKAIGQELSSRVLSPGEEKRVGAVFTLAVAEIFDRIEKGESVRDDGFFNNHGSGRSDVDEVWESALLKSQREAEEKKLPYMAHLLANIAFDTEISTAMAHQITKIAESLTYRQMCILKLSATKEKFQSTEAKLSGSK